MAAQPRHPYARHIRNELAREDFPLSVPMLDVVSNAMAMVSAMALGMGRNVMLLNVGSALAIDPKLEADGKAKRLDRIEDDLSDVVIATGQCVVVKRKDKATARASATLSDVLDDIVAEGAEGSFLVCAMDDGQVRVQLGANAAGHCILSRFMHCDDVSFGNRTPDSPPGVPDVMPKGVVGRKRQYDVVVAFLSNGEEFGREGYTVEATDKTAARRAALVKAEDSRFDDPRVPDLARNVVSCRICG